eukprot:CAMPEP_0195525180 /NCGR_PEP_ID=MMETSP0794_2-20130614/25481_1 /TAXON_ID=515487 /ORGANISM="Stephanopyxis turris, Strain CCMP 815" /LENGTH=265 /DNA_ID=CAMNT_0040655575 /DNA_START=81 /DNA_END=878 /DNA_ORIENTATION=+
MRPSIILFGDSITQQGFGWDGGTGWVSLLSHTYSRRADVFSRGFSGYNTRMAIDLLPRVFGGGGGGGGSAKLGETLFCTVFFGANDAALPGERQHVPLDEYGENLVKIVTSIREQIGADIFSTEQNSNNDESCGATKQVPIILFTPPPVDEEMWRRESDSSVPNRLNEVAKQYGEKVKSVANEYNCSVLDVFELLGGNDEPAKNTYGRHLRDGLHLSESGNTLVYEGLMALLQNDFPGLLPMYDGDGKYGTVGVPLEEKLWKELC